MLIMSFREQFTLSLLNKCLFFFSVPVCVFVSASLNCNSRVERERIRGGTCKKQNNTLRSLLEDCWLSVGLDWIGPPHTSEQDTDERERLSDRPTDRPGGGCHKQKESVKQRRPDGAREEKRSREQEFLFRNPHSAAAVSVVLVITLIL